MDAVKMSKGDFLRGFVAERLAAAAREITAALEGVVAGYEQQASGYRQEIERQSRLLEVLLKPRVSLSKAESGPAAAGSSRSLGSDEEEDEDQQDEDQQDQQDRSTEPPENLQDALHQSASRPEGTRSSRPQTSDAQGPVDLKIRILDQPQTELLSDSVLKTGPVVKLTCPRGLKESDFLDLLRSSVPQLSGSEGFDVFTSDERRRFQPLTPETLSETSTLYVRLKTRTDPEDEPRPQKNVAPPGDRTGSRDNSSTSDQEQEEDQDQDQDQDQDMSAPVEELVSDDDTVDTTEEEGRGLSDGDWKPEAASPAAKRRRVRGGGGGEKLHVCDVCCTAFALKAALETHQKLHQAEKPFRCFTCDEVFDLQEALKAHCRTHGAAAAKKKSFLCGVCGRTLSDYRSLSRHKMTHSEERPHGCQVCGRRFKLDGTLRQHAKIHTARERSYLCHVCCKMFLTSKQLHIHLRTHSGEKPFHCGECGKGFATKGPLTAHMRVHTGETPYRCPDCGWSFKRKINLDNHMTVHSGRKPFVCGICGKACARKTYLTVHMRTHSGERPYKCSVCDKAFTQSHCLKTHMKSHQGAEAGT